MLCVLLPYFLPALEQYRPWNPGEPVPLFRLLSSSSSVVESSDGTLISAVETTPDEVIYVSERARAHSDSKHRSGGKRCGGSGKALQR